MHQSRLLGPVWEIMQHFYGFDLQKTFQKLLPINTFANNQQR